MKYLTISIKIIITQLLLFIICIIVLGELVRPSHGTTQTQNKKTIPITKFIIKV